MSRFAGVKRMFTILLTGAMVIAASIGVAPTTVNADTSPPAGVPKTVSADPQPTVQINGVIWDQVVYGRTVYAVGNFTQARPAGVPIGGSGTVTRQNILAYDIVTGQLSNTFVHSLVDTNAPPDANDKALVNKVGAAVAVSKDGKYLYVGGKFTHVDGVAKHNFVAFNIATGAILPGFTAAPNHRVNSIAVDEQRVFIGGDFSKVGNVTRNRLAAYKLNGTLDSAWVANVGDNSTVRAVVRANNYLVVGGKFDKINGATYYSVGAVSATNGTNVPWASQSPSFPLRIQDPTGGFGTAVTDISTDGSQIYLTAFQYTRTLDKQGTFEGRWAISAANGSLIWMNDCVGDSYSSYPVGDVLYSASHAHSCVAVGGFPEVYPRRYQHALAETTYATGKNIAANGGSYPTYIGQPASTVLQWYPVFSTAPSTATSTSPIVSGASQAGWSVTGTVIDSVSYVAYGGEFPRVQGMQQQGLVRFKTTGTKRTATENKQGPVTGVWSSTVNARPASSLGTSEVFVDIYDPDNQRLTFDIYRADDNKLIKTVTAATHKSTLNSHIANFSGLRPGTTQRYNVKARDQFGNTLPGMALGAMDSTHFNVLYRGRWTLQTNTSTPDVNRTLHTTTAKDAEARAYFVGSEVKVLAHRTPGGGRVGISIDGGPETIVDTGRAEQQSTLTQQTIFTKTGLSLGVHYVRMRNIDAGKSFVFDAIMPKGDLFYDDIYTDNGLAYTGAWTNRQYYNRYEMGGGTHYTTAPNASASLKFRGRSIAIVSTLEPKHDYITATIDGKIKKDCNTAGASQKGVVVCSFTGLSANTEHTIVVKKKGANAHSIALDGFIVRP